MSKNEAKELGPMADPGTQLRRARERVGMTLKEVADKSLISAARLQALENQDFEKVGGVAYVTGYARAYTRIIGVDSEPYVQSFEALLGVDKQQAPPADFNLHRRKPWKLPKSILATLVLGIVLGGVAYVYYAHLQSSGANRVIPTVGGGTTSAAHSITPVSDEEEPVVAGNPSRAPARPMPAPADQVDVMEVSGVEEETSRLELEFRPPLEIAEEDEDFGGEQRAFEPDSSQTIGAGSPQDSLTISLRDECWVKVVDAAGTVKIAQIGQSGDNLQLFGPAPFDVVLGNARVADLVFNGDMVTVPVRAGHKTARFTIGAKLSNE